MSSQICASRSSTSSRGATKSSPEDRVRSGRLEDHERRRHHEVGQPLAKPGGKRSSGIAKNDVRHQPRVAAAVAPSEHDGFADRRVPREHRLDLAELDTEAADLDLGVKTAEELDGSAGLPAHQIARAVQALTRLPRVRHEILRGQLRPAQIAVRQAVAADVQLSSHAGGHQRLGPVEHVQGRVAQGHADGHAHRLRGHLPDRVPGREGGALGGTVAVEQAPRRPARQDRAGGVGIDRLASHEQLGHPGEGLRDLPGHAGEQGRGQEHGGHAEIAQGSGEIGR
jgi:hypothetical protein